MKKLFLADFIVVSALLLAVSCSTTSLTEKAVREAETLPLSERADFYEEKLKDDRSLPIFYNLIHTLIEEEEWDEAVSWLRIAKANHPSSMRLINAELYIARETENAELALRTLEEAVRRWPGDETFVSFWLRALRETGDDRALAEAEDAVRRFPQNQAALNILADSKPFFENKRKITMFDISKLDLPVITIDQMKKDMITRTWRSLSE